MTQWSGKLTEALGQLTPLRCIDYRPSTGVAELCGLTEPAVTLTVTYRAIAGETELTLRVGAQRDGGYYATVNDDDTIYLLPAAPAEAGGTGGQRFERISISAPSAGRGCLTGETGARKGSDPMRILVIEDEARLAQTLAELLHRQGYTADISGDGLSGLDNAASDIYDLVVLDAMLPGMDGFTLLQRRGRRDTPCRS